MSGDYARLRDDTLILEDLDYVFAGCGGRLFRFSRVEFSRLRARAGEAGGQSCIEALPALLKPCASAMASERSFDAARLPEFGAQADFIIAVADSGEPPPI
jgi:hypothetical protein